MASDKTLLQQTITFLQNNPIVVLLLLISAIVTGLATFTNSLNSLGEFAKKILGSTQPSGSKDEPTRLSPEQIKKLIVGKIEHGKLIKPTEAQLEGGPGTWYDAYYYNDGRMLYRRSASEFATEEWVWGIDDKGNLCRGPSKDCVTCRSIESIGNNRYRAVGFRTGTVRYEFYTKAGKPDELL